MNDYADKIQQIKQKLETELAASLTQREQKTLLNEVWGDRNLTIDLCYEQEREHRELLNEVWG